MAGMSRYRAQSRSYRIPRASDAERELGRMRHEAARALEPRGTRLTTLLFAVVAGLIGFIAFAGDGEGGHALTTALAALFG